MIEFVEKAALQGALTGGGSYLLHGQSNIVTPLGEFPLWMTTSLIGASSSFVNDLLHRYVFSEIPINKKARHDVSFILGAVTSGLLYNQALGLVNPDLPKEFGYYQGLAVGGGSEVLSGLLLDMIR